MRVVPAVSAPTTAIPTRLPDRLLADELEAALRDLLLDLPLAPAPLKRGPGAIPVISALALWSGFLVCVLRGFSSQRGVWRLLCLHGFWSETAKPLTDSAIYQRLARSAPTVFLDFFNRLTTLLLARFAEVRDTRLASWAPDILALDHCTMEPVVRQLKLLRKVPRGNSSLLPGRLATLFDVRRQLFRRVDFETDTVRNVKHELERLLVGLAPGTLLLFDLGYFSFPWFDLLVQEGLCYVSRLRKTTTWIELAVLYDGSNGQVRLRESWVYLGKYKADRAAEPVRLVEVFFPHHTYRYITNVMEPARLPAADIVRLYARRWDIEQAFNLLKTHLKLYLLWSGHPQVVQAQIFATLIIAQIVLALRNDLAQRARADLREISLPLLLECLPRLAADGKDALHELTLHGRRMEIIRPFRGIDYSVPAPALHEYRIPAARPPPRKPRHPTHLRARGQGPRVQAETRPRKSTWHTRTPRSAR